ncbi:MAG: phosphoribosylglycinamide formyltransferase [Candidatus Omnitrophica bacterium]|nr:phosphoribosylglycinamide formyltransferase [Candidatus Omnitrophota bacterium]MCF7877445.1 phosphoribosylglycinamide formyltransferase [Candidatus Omnitrophota bacterium]MCF7878052.1 phosphoribosylglycinamide formyltransferase [Candidatus Omnitrophota bacterium]MCF7892733.1 phosphoribosylglycinamide formyltransferase [Candidatus Omnitrophota bacterium]
MKTKTNLAILASGNGSNFEAIIKAVKKGFLNLDYCILVTDKRNSFVRERAKKHQIKDIFVDPKKFKSKKDFDKKLIQILNKEKIKIVVLAGYMRILSPLFLNRFKNKILNIHPSLLPSFAGKNAIEDAYNYGVKVTGVTVHFVTQKVDQGPIIAQKTVFIKSNMELKELEKEIHKTEHKLYPKLLKKFLENKIEVKGRHVKVT